MPFEPRDPDFDRKVRDSFARQQFMATLGAELTELAPGHCVISLPYRPELSQQHGYFHGGVIGTLADNSCGYAAYSLMPQGCSVLTVEYKLNLLAPGDGDLLIARGEVVKPGRTLTICRSEVIVVKDGREKLCATALATLMCMAGKSDGAPTTRGSGADSAR
ncbi:MAG: PaaI family thioesterase [Deltaproteobacteria bacterium]|nr:MAG: PaaI family thioesterase [Deltaproteobacteria bacterium]